MPSNFLLKGQLLCGLGTWCNDSMKLVLTDTPGTYLLLEGEGLDLGCLLLRVLGLL